MMPLFKHMQLDFDIITMHISEVQPDIDGTDVTDESVATAWNSTDTFISCIKRMVTLSGGKLVLNLKQFHGVLVKPYT